MLLGRLKKDATVIPQRAMYEVLSKQYVYTVDENHVAHAREIVVDHELEDLFVIKSGVAVGEKIVFEGVRQIHDGQTLECEELPAESVIPHLKYHAE